MPITLRYTKGAPLTHDELDTNFTHFFYDVAVTGSLVRFYRAQYDNTDANPNSSVTFPVNPPAGQDKHIQVRYGNALSGSEAIFTSSANYTFDYETDQVLLTGSQNILGNQSVDGDVNVTGTVTAREFKTIIESSQILVSGSTKFGDDNGDIHSFTGSVRITDNLQVSNGTFTLGLIPDVETELGNLDTSITALSSSASTDRVNKFNTLSSNITALSSSASTERTEHSSSLASSITALSSSASTERTANSSSLAASITTLSSSAATTYLKNTTDTLTGDLTVTGTLTANTYVVSSSVTHLTTSFSSGSTQFGDTADDIHTFTGSVNISQDITVVGNITGNITGSATNASTASYIDATNIDGAVETANTSSYILASNIDGTVTNASTASFVTFNDGLSTTSDVRFDSLGIGTDASGTTGEIRATGDITAYYSSDKRLKDNITPISDAINKLNQIGGYEFDWNSDSSHSGHDVGVIAQEIEKVLPEVVTTRDNGYMAVRYEKIVALLIQAVKEQQLQIDELKSKL